MGPQLFHRLQNVVAFELDSFDSRLKQLLAEEYPTSSARDLIQHLLEATKQQRERIAQIAQGLGQDPDLAFKLLRSEHRKLVVIYFPFVVYIQGAQTSRVPWSLVPGIEDLATFLHPGQALLTTCFEEFNYSLIWSRAPGGVAESEAGVGGSEIDKFDLLLIPSTHRLNAFLHVLVGHELFHPLLGDFLDVQQAQISDKLRAECQQILGEEPQEERLDRFVGYALNLWRKAMEELICDFGCAYIFGPAALMAYVAFSLCSDLNAVPTEPPYYPPSRYRIRMVLEHVFGAGGHAEQLKSLVDLLSANSEFKDIAQSFREFWSDIQGLANDDSDLKAIDSNPIHS